jgi:hypothetical protein
MKLRRVAVVFAVASAVTMLAAEAASAHSCVNVSRPPAACGMSCSEPVIDGKWVWLPSIGVPVPLWGMDKPGNAGESLLDQSAVCTGQGNAQDARQTDHGIQSGCE